MEQAIRNPEQVTGWGIDADPKNEPTYPMKERTNSEHAGYSWARPAQQPLTVEVLHSNERPNVTAVFGTSVPPAGLSGVIRRLAFRYSESSYAHWLPLMLADRVQMVEGLLDDLAHGHVPNLFVERGGKADWRYNRANPLLKLLVGVAVVGAGAVYLVSRGGARRTGLPWR